MSTEKDEFLEFNTPWLKLGEDTVSEEDYVISSESAFEIPLNTNEVKDCFYNQAKHRITRTSCGIFGALGCVSDLTWYRFSDDELLEAHHLAVAEFGLVVGEWMKMSEAVDCARTFWSKKFPENKIKSFRTLIGTATFNEWLEKWHSFAVGYRTSKEYFIDSQEDWKVDGENFPKVGGHLVRANKKNVKTWIDDNYIGVKKFNSYTNEKLEVLRKNGVYFRSAYIFLYDKSVEAQIKDNIDLSLAKEWYDLWLFNWLNPRQPASRQEVVAIVMKAMKLK